MEAGTAASRSTGSRTIADLMVCAAEQFADRVAVRHRVDGDWRDVTYGEVGDVVREIGLGLIDIGIAPGERVSLLCNTRPEWTYCDFAITSAGAVVVPIYPTNSPEECEWVAGNSESVAVVCEDASQVAKILAVRERLPALRTLVVINPAGETADAITLVSSSPRNNAVVTKLVQASPASYARTTIRLTFNQEMNPATLAANEWTLSPAVPGFPTTWSADTAYGAIRIRGVFPPGDYTFTLKAGATIDDKLSPAHTYTQATDLVIKFTIKDPATRPQCL